MRMLVRNLEGMGVLRELEIKHLMDSVLEAQ